MSTMLRTTITIDDELAADIDAYIRRSATSNRSEGIRDLVRRGLAAIPEESPGADCIGVLAYVVDQKISGLAKQIRIERLEQHDLIVSTLGIPVDHCSSIEIVVMRAKVSEVSTFSSRLFLKRGVRHGSSSLIPLTEGEPVHRHGSKPTHSHVRVQNSFGK